MAGIATGIDLRYLCRCCWYRCRYNQGHPLLAVIFIFSIVMGAPHTAEIAQRAVLGLGHQPTSGSYQPPSPPPPPFLHPHPATGRSTFGPPPPSMAAFPATMSGPNKLFTTANNTKVTAQRGGTALLPCSVISQTVATVSWIRRQDFQLLTVGLSTYSSDERFMVAHLRHWGLWALRIKSVRAEDEGIYECQLSVHPVQSVFVELKVVEAEAVIVGAPDLHIDEGSTLRLECKLERATENPTFVFWYHEQDMVNFDQLNGFSVTPFQPSVSGGHHHHLQHYLPNPVHDHDALPHSAEEEEDQQADFSLTDDEDELQRSLKLDHRIPSSSASASSSLLLASLAAAAFSAHSYQHLDSRGMTELVDSFELQDPAEAPVTDSSSSDAPNAQVRPHNHDQHQRLHHIHHHHQHQHQHHHQHHHFPRGAWPANYTSPLLYSHILTPAPSVLTIRKVHFKHAGNYTCAPSNARPASITVHVLQDKKPAAMQHANRSQLDDGGKQSRSGADHQVGPSVMIAVLALLVAGEWVAHHLCSRRFTHR
ncbi:uncharacterized protein LOC118468784 [Anopheles albimanus]|uniref:uncharacterized protein LOC118468784 n=1 Tax=Anopheles albimanus TaxID=7167 RepID=UPI0016406BFF|nr:uncharacterized protein LOC118468784 [Anopheles albimanus]XP_035795875.1 uncharacterized protein LOC118468784 [Anopheles albimanus]XP_035795876.1 uncharacterized protein LOC118468784 [Anopheles albimanus]XP_035795877.1 uncharacterized protein LOC118468784 [Anopheles albimanus]XP_035795878.1 uncharacterized protein LOC118468784 [Anopheles albimanus]XP_035795879.1 uncharacterized protein LOC118468784 [Anopheles albimanus]